jgi:hypothetical protein
LLCLYVQTVTIGDKLLQEGDWLSLNGSSGEVVLGKQPLSPPALSGDLGTFMSWVDGVRQLKVNLRNNEKELNKGSAFPFFSYYFHGFYPIIFMLYCVHVPCPRLWQMPIPLMMHWQHGTMGRKELDYAERNTWYAFIITSLFYFLITRILGSLIVISLSSLQLELNFRIHVYCYTKLNLCFCFWQFFASDERIKAVRQMIMAPNLELRQKALDLLLPYQRSDFEGIFRAMDGK